MRGHRRGRPRPGLQDAITWGAKAFRDGIAAKTAATHPGWTVDPETELTVTCGWTEAMIATLLATVDPGDEVVVFEPWYENDGPDAVLSGAVPRFVRLHGLDWSIDEAELRAAFSDRTCAIIVNTPHNPTGKVFTRAELALVSELCQTHDALCLTDEIYEHILYDAVHVPPATVRGLEDRTVTISALSKTYDRLPALFGCRPWAGLRQGCRTCWRMTVLERPPPARPGKSMAGRDVQPPQVCQATHQRPQVW